MGMLSTMDMLSTNYMSDFADPSLPEKDQKTLVSEGSLLVEKSVNHWIESANKLPDAEKAALVALVNRKAKTIFARMDALQKANCSSEIIRRSVLQHLVDLNLSAETFYESKQQYIERQRLVHEKNNEIHGKINALKPQSTLEFKARKEMPLYSHLLKTNRMKVEEKTRKQFYMAHAHVIASGVDVFILPVILQITGVLGALDHAQKTVCQIHPHMENTCRQISTLTDEIFERALTLVPGAITEIIHKIGKNYEGFVKTQVDYNEKLGIPEEKTRQFIKDVTKITSVFGGTAALGMIGAKNAAKLIAPAKTQAKLPVKSNKEAALSVYNQTRSASASITSKTSTDLVVPSSTFIPKKVTIEEKRAAAWNKYCTEISREQSYLKALKMGQPSNLPKGFPPHANKFYSSSQLLPFERKNLGPDKKQWIRDRIKYQPMKDSDSAIFLISRSKSLRELVLEGEVIKKPASKGLDTLGKTKETLNAIFDFSENQGYKRVFLVWDSERYAVISNLPTTDKIRIASVGKFSNGLASKPFDLVEVLINK